MVLVLRRYKQMCISKADSVRCVGTGLILALGRYRHAFVQEWVVLVW